MKRHFTALSILLLAGLVTRSEIANADAVAERAFIDSTITVPSSVMTMVGTIFPEASAVGASYLSPIFDPNLSVTEAATVTVTFLWEGAGYKNSFGYFTYNLVDNTIQIVDRQLVFPNASFADPNKGWGGGTLVTGDTVTLRDSQGTIRIFQPGEHIGFFLVSNGWSSTLPWWTIAAPTVPAATASANASKSAFTTIDGLNPEVSASRSDVARHSAMVHFAGISGFLNGDDFFVVGMEDQRRDIGSDNDFNDVMFLVHATPETAIAETNVPSVDPNNQDPDGDGVKGLSDYFPDDPERAFVIRTPAASFDTIAFEDLYPSAGDRDYNDAVIQFAYENVTAANGNIKEIVGTYHLIARGAGLDHSFGVELAGLPSTVTGTMSIERFTSDDAQSIENGASIDSMLISNGNTKNLRIADIFPSTHGALPSAITYANTLTSTPDLPPASTRVRIVFDTPVSPTGFSTSPHDPFLAVKRGVEDWDIHLAGKKGFAGRPSHLPDESTGATFIDDTGHPWALLVPFDWRYPLEKKPIDGSDAAYPQFDTWAKSSGAQYPTWFKFPTGVNPTTHITNPVSNAVRTRPWTLVPGG